jgi:hypothetical protein
MNKTMEFYAVTIVEDKRVRECGNFGEQRDEKSDKGQ